MVFGNLNFNSGSGVLFSRNPLSGEPELTGEYLVGAQGEQLELGDEEPLPLNDLQSSHARVFDALYTVAQTLERNYRDMQEIEFTFENGSLYVMSARNGRRSLRASLRILADLVEEALIGERAALLRIAPTQLEHFLIRKIDHAYVDAQNSFLMETSRVGMGRAMFQGIVSGEVVFSAEQARECQQRGQASILCTNKDSLDGYQIASGILTTHRPSSSMVKLLDDQHKVAVLGVENMTVDTQAETVSSHQNVLVFRRGDYITLDGSTGTIYRGDVPTVTAADHAHFKTVLQWADCHKRLLVKARARSMEDVHTARSLGADGIILLDIDKFLPRSVMHTEVFISPSPRDVDTGSSWTKLPLCKEMVSVLRALNGQRVTFRLGEQKRPKATDARHKIPFTSFKKKTPSSENFQVAPVESILGESTLVGSKRRCLMIVVLCVM
jgi:pyruvate,orthophosphate dikinase